MNYSSRTRTILLSLLVVTVCFALPVAGQVKKRIIMLPEWSTLDEQEEDRLELIEIKVAGRPVIPGQAFDADENWLKDMTLRVKLIGPKPVVAFQVSGVLFAGLNEKPLPHESVKNGLGWRWGKGFDPEKEKHRGAILKPGEIIELSYKNVSQLYRRVLAKEEEGGFCKLELGPGFRQYEDGTFLNPLIKYTGNRKP